MNDKKTILLLSPEFGEEIVGGLGRHVNDLVEVASKYNMSLIVITISGQKEESYTVKDGVHIFRLLPWKKESAHLFDFIQNINFRVIQFILQELHLSFDLIHVHDWMFAFAACYLKKELHVPLISTIHSTETERKQFNNGKKFSQIIKYEDKLIGSSDRLIVCSFYMKNIIEKQKRKNLKIDVIPNGVIKENFLSTLDSKRALKQFPFIESPYLFAMGRLVKEKGFHLFIEAFAAIHKEFPECRAVIAGEGPFEVELRELVRSLQIEPYVFFTGFIKGDERNTLLKSCHLFVVPSLYEPFGIVALEAMVLKKPTIAFTLGGLKEVLSNNRGILVEQVNSQCLAEQVRFALSHPEQLNTIGSEGYDAVIKEYQWEKIIKKYINIYYN